MTGWAAADRLPPFGPARIFQRQAVGTGPGSAVVRPMRCRRDAATGLSVAGSGPSHGGVWRFDGWTGRESGGRLSVVLTPGGGAVLWRFWWANRTGIRTGTWRRGAQDAQGCSCCVSEARVLGWCGPIRPQDALGHPSGLPAGVGRWDRPYGAQDAQGCPCRVSEGDAIRRTGCPVTPLVASRWRGGAGIGGVAHRMPKAIPVGFRTGGMGRCGPIRRARSAGKPLGVCRRGLGAGTGRTAHRMPCDAPAASRRVFCAGMGRNAHRVVCDTVCSMAVGMGSGVVLTMPRMPYAHRQPSDVGAGICPTARMMPRDAPAAFRRGVLAMPYGAQDAL